MLHLWLDLKNTDTRPAQHVLRFSRAPACRFRPSMRVASGPRTGIGMESAGFESARHRAFQTASLIKARILDWEALALCAKSCVTSWLLNCDAVKSTIWRDWTASNISRIPNSTPFSQTNPKQVWILSNETR